MQPRLFIEQKITPIVNRYKISNTDESGAPRELAAFVEQKRASFREKIVFYRDDSKQELLFTLRAEKVLDVHGKYLVEDASGTLIGTFRKDFKKSLLSSTWHVLNAEDQSIISITESSKTLAILRRFIGFIPLVGDFAELAVAFFRYHFVFLDTPTGTQIGMYKKVTTFRDKYLFSMNQTYEQSDWRLYAAIAVALDALQSR